jgi:hypothetical protein
MSQNTFGATSASLGGLRAPFRTGSTIAIRRKPLVGREDDFICTVPTTDDSDDPKTGVLGPAPAPRRVRQTTLKRPRRTLRAAGSCVP